MTAIVAQQVLGGKILKIPTAVGVHYYNRINGARHDFTAAQFDIAPEYQGLPSNADEAMSDTSPEQVRALTDALGLP